MAGCCTAVSAARLGCKVALIQDRPVLGGNNSSEVRVGLSGLIHQQPYPRLGDLVDEIGPIGHWNLWEAKRDPDSPRASGSWPSSKQHPEKKTHNAGPASNYEDDKKRRVVRGGRHRRRSSSIRTSFRVEKEGQPHHGRDRQEHRSPAGNCASAAGCSPTARATATSASWPAPIFAWAARARSETGEDASAGRGRPAGDGHLGAVVRGGGSRARARSPNAPGRSSSTRRPASGSPGATGTGKPA